MKTQKVLCKKCEAFVFGLLNELRNQAKKSNRGNLIIDAIDDLQVSLEDGNISQVQIRDESYQAGNKVGRRIKK
jgi:hypothetical protein